MQLKTKEGSVLICLMPNSPQAAMFGIWMPGLSNSKPNCYVCIFLKNLFSIRQADLLELKCSQDKKNPSNKQDRDQVKADSSLTEK